MTKAPFVLRHGRNPDVLSCIANLSNDEVFTPPDFANRMLDTLEKTWAAGNGGASVWENSELTFLDPCTKTGVFLREITKRLIKGLEPQIPDLQERVDHILTKQVFGIAITDLTAMLARRSLYCSKHANGPHSIARNCINTEAGNIWFERTEHTWQAGKCIYCGASESALAQSDERENHAYPFIHTDNIKERISALFGENMQFDVLIGNPPYQLADGGAGASAKPIYHKFITQAKVIEPKYLSMVTPARWIAGGKGLDKFRGDMLDDNRMSSLVDFLNASDAFPGVDVAGGITYFLWDRDHAGSCEVTTIHKGTETGPVRRRLNEFDVFIRSASAVSIIHKLWPMGVITDQSMTNSVSSRSAFGFPSNARGHKTISGIDDPIELISSSTIEDNREWINRADVKTNLGWLNLWKATFGGAAPAGGRPDKNGMYYGLSSVRVLPPNTACTESYLVAGAFEDKNEAMSVDSYLRTRFVRFLIAQRAVTQHVTKSSFLFVPIQNWDRIWTEAELYQKYNLTDKEIDFIENTMRPMGFDLAKNSADS